MAPYNWGVLLEHDNSCVVRVPVSRYTRTLVILFRFFVVPMFRAVLTIFDALYAPCPPFATEHSLPFLDVDRPARTFVARSVISRPRVLSPSVLLSFSSVY